MITIELLRQFRIADYAIFDIIISFLGIYLFAPLLSKLFLKFNIIILRKSWLFLTLPIAIIFHLIVGKITPMTANFFDLKGHFGLKIIILSLFYLGLKDVRVFNRKV